MGEHTFPAVGRHDRKLDVETAVNPVRVRMVHRAGMERRDLVVVEIGGDEGLRGEGVADHTHVVAREAERIEPVEIRARVFADRRHDERLAALATGSPPSNWRFEPTFPAQPPYSRRSSGTRNATLRMWICSGRIWSLNRPRNTMMLS